VIFGLKVFAIGGGTGLSALLAGLKHFVDPPPKQTKDVLYFADLASLVTVTEDLLHPGSVVRHDGIKTARALKSLFHWARVRPQMRGVAT